MASMTYCRSTRRCCYRLEQSVLLIIAFLAYAAGIRNIAPLGNANNKGTALDDTTYELTERITQQRVTPTNNDYQRPITPPSAPDQASSDDFGFKSFRPSQQILDFTVSDATSTTNVLHAPTHHQQQQQHYVANKRYNSENTQFSFPKATSNVAKFDGPFKRITTSVVSTVRPYAQTTPTLSYHDPFTYQNYQASPPSSPSSPSLPSSPLMPPESPPKLQFEDNDDIIYYGQQGSVYEREDAPQAYTVQSTLLVGNNNPNRGNDNSVSHDFGASVNGYRPLSSPNNEYKRPGYVFDEQIQPNNIRNTNKFNHRQHQYQQQQQQQQLNVFPATTYVDGKQQAIPQHLSYDSHDYPPPSYYQRPTFQHEHQKQPKPEHQQQHSTYFHTPQRQDIGLHSISQPTEPFNVDHLGVASTPTASTISTPLTFSNYANNFGNYLLNDADQQQSQYSPHQIPSPNPHPHPHPHSHQKQQQQQYPVNYRPSYPPGNYYPHQYHRQEPQQSQRPSVYRPTGPKPSNYYDYQLGEIPPARPTPPPPLPHNYPNYGVQRPTSAATQTPPSGLASLASLFTTTQQYAPQFTNLLLGALTSGGGGDVDAASTYSTYNRPSQQQKRPINMQLIRALENIARNDDLQCVPKVLCQTIAGQTQRGQLPSFITSPAITNFLAGFPAASPALIYGRAALLGISGGERSCAQTYAQCPKSEYEIIHYLNNHRGGFFKFFSEPEEQPATSSSIGSSGNYVDSSGGGGGGNGGISSSLLSILSVLAGTPTLASTQRTTTTTSTTTPSPSTSANIAGGIGSFFTQVLTDYLSGVEYQRRRRRRRQSRSVEDFFRPEADGEVEVEVKMEAENAKQARKVLNDEDFHDEEDNEDTNDDGYEDDLQYDDVQPRILHKDATHGNGDYPKFFPEEQWETASALDEAVTKFNADKTVRKLKFPNRDVDNRNPGGGSWVSFVDTTNEGDQNYDLPAAGAIKSTRRGKKLNFQIHNDYETSFPLHHNNHVEETGAGQHVIFPDHYEQYIRKGRILNRPSYASSFGDYERTSADESDDRFVLSNAHRRPHYQEFQDGSSNYYDQINSQNTASSSSSSSSGGYGNRNRFSSTSQETGFRPTRIPESSHYAASSNSQSYYNNNKHNNKIYNYPNNNYAGNNRYSSNNQRPSINTTTRRPRHEDDQNVYVTNGQGVTAYYITPSGRKVYLRDKS